MNVYCIWVKGALSRQKMNIIALLSWQNEIQRASCLCSSVYWRRGLGELGEVASK